MFQHKLSLITHIAHITIYLGKCTNKGESHGKPGYNFYDQIDRVLAIFDVRSLKKSACIDEAMNVEALKLKVCQTVHFVYIKINK